MSHVRPLLSESDSEYEPPSPPELIDPSIKATKGEFISKIYTIMLLQITGCFGVTMLTRGVDSLREFLTEVWVLVVGLVVLFGIAGVLFGAKEFVKRKTVTYVLFVVYCLNQLLLMSIVSAYLNAGIVLICQSMCFTVTLALLIYASFAKVFSSSLGLPIAIFSTVLAFALFMRITYDTNPMELVSNRQILCTAFVVVYSVYIVVDVQLLVAGEAYGLTYDQHFLASVYLLLDVFNVLWSFLIMSKSSLE